MDVIERKVVYIVRHYTAMSEERARVCDDLFEAGVDGDDAVEIFEALKKECDIDFSTLQWGRHFGHEGGNLFSILFSVLLPSYKRFHRQRKAVGVADLINAARSKRWSLQYDEAATSAPAISGPKGT